MVKIEVINDSNVSNDSGPTLCLNMIVKNESKIIIRLLESVSKIIDTYLICDTGSSDNTIELITEYFKEKNIEGKIIKEPFKNFEYNRSFALKACYENNMADYILLLDADMVLQVHNFNKNMLLSAEVFTILQGTSHFYYKNVRIIKNSDQTHYVGVTHEYLSHPNEFRRRDLTKEELFILDIGDGGAKSDKSERDIRLLTEGIKNDPTNGRYYFYLANTYKDAGQHEKAIETYLAKIKLGGWFQEIWQSYYKIGHCYKDMNNKEEAIKYWNKCSEVISERLENVYNIISLYRYSGENHKAYEYYCKARPLLEKHLKKELDRDDYLFLENDVYTYKLFYEFTIIAYYNKIHNIDREMMTVLNTCSFENTVSNILSNHKFYVNILKYKRKIDFSATFKYGNEKMKSSSAALIHHNGKYLMNMRYVNYTIIKETTGDRKPGAYIDCENAILTLNKCVELSDDLQLLNETLIYPNKVEYSNFYLGYEDVRLFVFENEIYFSGISMHRNQKIGVSLGKYEINNNIIKAKEYEQKFKETNCEKNWMFVNYKNKLAIIYSLYPLILCDKNEETCELDIFKINTKMPLVFKHARGSSNGFKYNNENWFIVHYVCYGEPRIYYNMFVVFDEDMNLLRYSGFFKFTNCPIEYCLSIYINDNNEVLIPYSTWDSTTDLLVCDKKYIDSLLVYS